MLYLPSLGLVHLLTLSIFDRSLNFIWLHNMHFSQGRLKLLMAHNRARLEIRIASGIVIHGFPEHAVVHP